MFNTTNMSLAFKYQCQTLSELLSHPWNKRDKCSILAKDTMNSIQFQFIIVHYALLVLKTFNIINIHLYRICTYKSKLG